MSMYKKQYPGVYTPAQQQVLDDLNGRLQENAGKPAMFGGGDADPTLMRLYAKTWDPWNPLYNDPEYAKTTCWGTCSPSPAGRNPAPCSPPCPWTLMTS